MNSTIDSHSAPQTNDNCFGCGDQNPHGLKLHYVVADDGSVRAEWMPSTTFESFRGVIHGGILTTVLDEAMAKAILATGTQAFTCDLRVRMRDSVRPGSKVHARGWIVERRKRMIKTEASLCSPDGDEYAHAWASFLVPAN